MEIIFTSRWNSPFLFFEIEPDTSRYITLTHFDQSLALNLNSGWSYLKSHNKDKEKNPWIISKHPIFWCIEFNLLRGVMSIY
jgi:hypothetical protein